MGRLHHLRQTLPRNLEWTADVPGVEFVLVNYSSPDGLDDWVRSECEEALASGRLTYFCVNGCRLFRVGHAKNVAHRIARGDIVCNLDADNFLGPGFAENVRETLRDARRTVLRAPFIRSAAGRIALWKEDFAHLGGYDERMGLGWGYDDRDLVVRALVAGYREQVIPADRDFLGAINHSHAERVRFAEEKDRLVSDELHRHLSAESLQAGAWRANRNLDWGAVPRGGSACSG
jgi:hypothetical protein